MRNPAAVLVALACCAMLFGLTACTKGDATREPNVVLIVLDTMRAQNWPTYGYRRDTTPFLAELESRSVVFDNAFSASSWTAPSTASIHTSLYPFQHGVLHGYFLSKGLDLDLNRIPGDVTTVATMLADAGYRTYGVADNINISEAIGFNRGFDWFDRFPYKDEALMDQKLVEWSDTLKGEEEYFLYIHYNDAHAPLHEREPWYEKRDDPREDTVAKYDSEIRYVDEKIGRMYELYGWDENTLVIVVADHGEEFWEHGQMGHGYSLYTEVTRVPLFVHFPPGHRKAKRIKSNVSALDILPTIAGFLDLELDQPVSGIDLMPLIRGREASGEPRFIFSHLVYGKKNPRAPMGVDTTILKSVVWGKWHYIFRHDPESGEISDKQLFDRSVDPGETTNVYSLYDTIADRMLAEYYTFEKNCRKYTSQSMSVELDADKVEELRRLGYVK